MTCRFVAVGSDGGRLSRSRGAGGATCTGWRPLRIGGPACSLSFIAGHLFVTGLSLFARLLLEAAEALLLSLSVQPRSISTVPWTTTRTASPTAGKRWPGQRAVTATSPSRVSRTTASWP